MNCPKCDELLIVSKIIIDTNQVFLPETKRHYVIHEYLNCKKCNGTTIFHVSVPMGETDTRSKILDEMDKIIAVSGKFAEKVKEMDKNTKVMLFPMKSNDDTASSEF